MQRWTSTNKKCGYKKEWFRINMTWVQPMLATNCSVGASTRKRQPMWPGRPQVQVQQTSASLQKSTGRGNKLLRPQLETSNDVWKVKSNGLCKHPELRWLRFAKPWFRPCLGNWYVLFVDASMNMYELNTPKHTKRNDWESKDRMTYCMSSFRRKHLMRQVPKTWPPSLRNIKAKKD